MRKIAWVALVRILAREKLWNVKTTKGLALLSVRRSALILALGVSIYSCKRVPAKLYVVGRTKRINGPDNRGSPLLVLAWAECLMGWVGWPKPCTGAHDMRVQPIKLQGNCRAWQEHARPKRWLRSYDLRGVPTACPEHVHLARFTPGVMMTSFTQGSYVWCHGARA